MAKLPNTTANKLKLTGGLVGGFAIIGALMSITSKNPDKITVLPSMAIGALVALFITMGVSSWVIEQPVEK